MPGIYCIAFSMIHVFQNIITSCFVGYWIIYFLKLYIHLNNIYLKMPKIYQHLKKFGFFFRFIIVNISFSKWRGGCGITCINTVRPGEIKQATNHYCFIRKQLLFCPFFNLCILLNKNNICSVVSRLLMQVFRLSLETSKACSDSL